MGPCQFEAGYSFVEGGSAALRHGDGFAASARAALSAPKPM
jgi:hypothetical protein